MRGARSPTRTTGTICTTDTIRTTGTICTTAPAARTTRTTGTTRTLHTGPTGPTGTTDRSVHRAPAARRGVGRLASRGERRTRTVWQE